MAAKTMLLLAALAFGQCGEPAETQPAEAPAVEAPVAEEVEEPDEDDLVEEDPLEEPPRALSDDEIEAMSRGELEAACFRGSTAACDALGH